MSEQLIIKKASRQGVRPLIGLYSESGCGKTYSSLLLARGFVGPTGKIVMIDTESGRGELYADVLPGGYEVLTLRDPFTPARYIEAIQAVERSGATIGIIDSASHEWEGIGGVLDMAAEAEHRSGKPGLHNWRAPKLEHNKFLMQMLRSSIPWIVCLRAKFKTRQGKGKDNRTEIVRDDHTTPIQAEDFIFEMTVHGEIMPNHAFRLTKCSHPDLEQVMPNNSPIKTDHGERLAKWCASPGTKNGNGATDKNALLSELRAVTESIHGWRKGMSAKEWQELKPALDQYLWDNAILSDTEALTELDTNRLAEVLTKTKEKLSV